MLQQPGQELIRGKFHERDFLPSVMKLYLPGSTPDNPLVGDGTAPKIAGQIGHHPHPMGIGLSQIDVPGLSAQLVQKIAELVGLHPLRKHQLSPIECFADPGKKFAPEKFPDHFKREKIGTPNGAPSFGLIPAATGDQHMKMGMEQQSPGPGMKGSDQSRLGAKVFLIAK